MRTQLFSQTPGRTATAESSHTITSVSPSSGQPGAWVTITGTGFGQFCSPTDATSRPAPVTGKVYFGSYEALTIHTWTDTSIVAMVPAQLYVGGSAAVKVQVNGVDSSSVSFTATAIPTNHRFYVSDYGAVGGPTNEHTEIGNAYTAAENAAKSGGNSILFFDPTKTYKVGARSITTYPCKTNDWRGQTSPTVVRSGTVIIEGWDSAHTQRAKILFDSAVTTRYGFVMSNYAGASDITYGNLVLDGFDVDDNGRYPSGETGSLFWIWCNTTSYFPVNIDNVVIKDCYLHGCHDWTTWTPSPSLNLCGIFARLGEAISLTAAHWMYCRNFTVDGCSIKSEVKPLNFGEGGGAQQEVLATGPHLYWDDIVLRNSTFNVSRGAGTATHIGGNTYVGTVIWENCYLTNSGDNLIEISEHYRCLVWNTDFSWANSGLGLSRFTLMSIHPDGGSAMVPYTEMLNCRYTGGANPVWFDGDYTTTMNGNLIGFYSPYGTTETLGDVYLKGCSLVNTDYDSRRNSELSYYCRKNQVTIEDCYFEDLYMPSSGYPLIDLRQRTTNTGYGVTMRNVSFKIGGGSSTDFCWLRGVGCLDIDIDGISGVTNQSGQYFDLQAGAFAGTIRDVTAGATTQTGTQVVVIASGCTGSLTVRDSNFTAMKTGTDTCVNNAPATFTLTETNNTTPAG